MSTIALLVSEDRLDKTEEQRRIDSNNIAQILYLQAEMLKILKDNLNMQMVIMYPLTYYF